MPTGLTNLTFGDGRHDFNIAPIGSMLELQDNCDAGPAEIFSRLRNGLWRVNDVRETIRIGLIGGGMKPVDALKLVDRYVGGPRPWSESVPVASSILLAALVGVPDDPVGKTDADRAKTETVIPTADSSDPHSTEPAPLSDSIQEP
jgi:hypothetical protein